MSKETDQVFSRSRKKRFWNQPDLLHLLICVLVIAVHVALLASGRFQRLEYILYDYFARQRPSQQVSPAILVVEIDKESIQSIGKWPWPVTYHAQMIRLLEKWGAKAILYDNIFKESSTTEESNEFQKALAASKHVYFPVSLETKSEKKIWVHSMPIVLEPEGEKLGWVHSSLNYEKLSAGQGHVNLQADSDGILRRVRPHLSFAGSTYPYLPMLVAYDYLGKGMPGPLELPVPVDDKDYFFINWTRPWHPGFPTVTFSDLIRSSQAIDSGQEPPVDLKIIKDKICVIGMSAYGYASITATPADPSYPALGVHANVLNSILTHQFIYPTSFAVNIFCLCAIGFASSLLFAILRSVVSFMSGLGLGFLWLIFAFALFSLKGIWIYSAHPLMLILSLFIFSAIYGLLVSAREQRQLYDLATRDGLTGLYVIRHFREILNVAVEESQKNRKPLSLILIDIDNFKTINDTYGHPAGDMVLTKTAHIICSYFRSRRPLDQIDFVARYGGEEFIVMARNAKLADAAFKAAERIRKNVESAIYQWEDKIIPVTISLGVSSLHSGENIPDLMVRRADEALYRAKKAGKNQVCIETFATNFPPHI